MTAAQLEQRQIQSAAGRPPVEAFRAGTRVEHPEYGTGRVTEVSGTGLRRTATVEFAGVGTRRFRLSHSNLRIVD